MMQRIIDRVNQLDPWIGVTIAIMTIYAALIGMLQVHASNLNTQYRAETQRYAIEAMRIRSAGETQSAFDTGTIERMRDLIIQQRDLASQNGEVDVAQKMELLHTSLNLASPILQPPYDKLGDQAISHYEVDTYLSDAIRAEQFRAAYAPMDEGWDSKANTYIVHLTLIALVLALLGLGAVMHNIPRAMVLTMAMIITIITTGWVLTTYLEPVPTLNVAAIDAYTKAYDLAYEGDYAGALTGYADAIKQKSDYADAYFEQAWLLYEHDKYPEALESLANARKYGYDQPSIDNLEGYIMMLQGHFGEAETATNGWLAREPHSIPALGQQIAVQLARDDTKDATTDLASLDKQMRDQVTKIRAKGDEPDDQLWVMMNDMTDVIEDVILAGQNNPDSSFPAVKISPETISLAQDAIYQLRSTAITLEYNIKPSTAQATDIEIGAIDANNAFTANNTFRADDLAQNPLVLHMNAQNIATNAHVLVRFYLDGNEDASLRYVGVWSGANDGATTVAIPIDIGPTYVLPAGDYEAELYIDGVIQGDLIPFKVTE